MAIFRIEVGADSETELTRAMQDVPDAAETSPNAEWLLGGRNSYGAYVLLRGEQPAPLTQLLEEQGLAVGGISEISPRDFKEGTFALSPDDVWCPEHHAYHRPPAHRKRG